MLPFEGPFEELHKLAVLFDINRIGSVCGYNKAGASPNYPRSEYYNRDLI